METYNYHSFYLENPGYSLNISEDRNDPFTRIDFIPLTWSLPIITEAFKEKRFVVYNKHFSGYVVKILC